MTTLRYHVKNLINPDSIRKNCEITVSGGMISEIREGAEIPKEETAYYAIPGFIDIHTHGADGVEVMDNSAEALHRMSRFYLRHGTTSFLASTVTDSLAKTESVLQAAGRFLPENDKLSGTGSEARCLGVHLEGPWLSRMNLGAQNPDHCIVPGPESLGLIDRYAGLIKMVTFSYHTPESEKLLQLLLEKSIVPACGHDETLDERITHGFTQGIKVVTHVYCVTSSFRRVDGLKHLGTLEMGLMTDGVKVEVIADGKHITRYFWDFIRHNKAYDDILIVSDSMRCAGLPEDPEKIYKLGKMDVIVDQGVAWTKDRSAFAGSVATMYSNFKRLVSEWGVDIRDAVKITSRNQAELLGQTGLGELAPGKKADILLLDESLAIRKIIKSGQVVDLPE